MPTKSLSRQTLPIFIVLGLAFFLVFISYLIPQSFIQSSAATAVKSKVVLPKQSSEIFSLPARLSIPKIKVNALIESLGLTSEGAMAVPKGPANVAWFNLGARPGSIGSAVMAGHYGVWKNGQKGAFNNLAKLRPGDKVYVKDNQGVVTTFMVREFRTYGQDDNAPEVFSSIDGKAHLNLVTCLGAWNKVTKSYSKRFVVFTDQIYE